MTDAEKIQAARAVILSARCASGRQIRDGIAISVHPYFLFLCDCVDAALNGFDVNAVVDSFDSRAKGVAVTSETPISQAVPLCPVCGEIYVSHPRMGLFHACRCECGHDPIAHLDGGPCGGCDCETYKSKPAAERVETPKP